MRQLGLRGRLLIAVAIPSALVAAVFAVLVWTIVAYRTAAESMRTSEQSIAHANRLEKLVLTLETGQRGFTTTGQERLLEPWEAARRQLPRAVAEFEALNAEPEVQRIGDLVLTYRDEYSLPLIALGRENLEAARRMITWAEGKRRVDELRTALEAFEAEERRKADGRRRRTDDLASWAVAVGIAGLAGTGLLAFVFFAYLSQAVLTPVRRLAQATGRLAAGDLLARVAHTGHGDEVGKLGAAFNAMAESLQEKQDELATQNAELERAVTELAEERDRIVALYRFAEHLSEETEVETLGLAILNDLSEACRADTGALYAAGVHRHEGYRLVASAGFHPEQLPAELDPGEVLPPGLGNDVAHELHLPLVHGDRAVGFVTLSRLGDPDFSRREREGVEGLAAQAAVALSNVLALRRAQRQASVTRAVLDATPDGICLTDAAGQIRLANAPMLELAVDLGLPMEGTVHERLLAAADGMVDPDAYRAGMAEIAANPDREIRQTYELADSGRAYLGYAAPVRDAGGGLVGRIFMLREVTAEREAERLKDELVATVSHELRTPLTSIIGYLELVMEESDDHLSDEQRQFLEIVDRNARRLLDVVGDLLFVAQVEAGRLKLELEQLDPAQLVAESVEAARPLAEAKEIALVSLVEPGLRVNGDRLRLNQLLANLVSNAVKFTPREGEVEVRVQSVDSRAVLEVSDTGIGIPSEEQERLFERFFRSSTAAARAIQGTGLGLVICKAIAEAHGGAISFTSEEGKGTTFAVSLPLAARVEALTS